MILGAVIAGGQNTRYGALKALEMVGGRRIIDRVTAAIKVVTPHVVLITNDPQGYASVDLPKRGDRVSGAGALAGIDAALRWAAEDDYAGIVAVACDMPFVSAPLLQRVVAGAASADVVIPESSNRRGVEPLCAYYSVQCVPAIEQAFAREDYRMIGFHDAVTVHRIPIEEVHQLGDPAVLFMNVNTREERERAEQIAAHD